MDGFLLFFFLIVIGIIVRAAFATASRQRPQSTSSRTRTRQQLQQVVQRMRAVKAQGGPAYQPPPTAHPGSTAPFERPPTAVPQSTAPFQPPPTAVPQSTAPFKAPPIAPVAPPTQPFTARWPSGAPMPPSPPYPQSDRVVVEIAAPSEGSVDDTEPTGADSAPDVTSDAASDVTAPTRGREPYELSSSLDTTLSTSLTDSTLMETGSVGAGPRALDLPPTLRQQVLDLMGQGYEVMAVRLVCDELDVGILDAHKTVRTVAGLPTYM